MLVATASLRQVGLKTGRICTLERNSHLSPTNGQLYSSVVPMPFKQANQQSRSKYSIFGQAMHTLAKL